MVVEEVPGAVIVHDHQGNSLKLPFDIWPLTSLSFPCRVGRNMKGSIPKEKGKPQSNVITSTAGELTAITG